MNHLLHQRCFNHAEREAVARCPECARFFCRECITEFDDRAICAACLKTLARVPLIRRPAFIRFRQAARCALSLLILWFFFFVIGELLLRLPDSFHEGTLWEASWLAPE